MLHGGARDDETGAYSIEINPKIVALYGREGWTQVEWQQRLALKGQPLAQWLHGFYTTHAQPYPYRAETLHKLCGSEAKNLTDFRKDLRKAGVWGAMEPKTNVSPTNAFRCLLPRRPSRQNSCACRPPG